MCVYYLINWNLSIKINKHKNQCKLSITRKKKQIKRNEKSKQKKQILAKIKVKKKIGAVN